MVWLFVVLAILLPIHSNADNAASSCTGVKDGLDFEAMQAFQKTMTVNTENCTLENAKHIQLDKNCRVTEINIEGCNINGLLVPELGNLTMLIKLMLNGNDFSGSTIPSELGNLLNLIVLNLSYCNLSGPIPNELENLKNMTILSLSSNHLNGTVPKKVAENINGMLLVNLTDNKDLTGRCTNISCCNKC